MHLSTTFSLSIGFLLLIYPVLIFLGFKNQMMEITTSFLFILLAIRSIILFKNRSSLGLTIFTFLIFSLFLCLIALVFKSFGLVKFYPVLISLALAIVFGQSLVSGNTPFVEKIARIYDNEFPENAIKYTRQVTKVWFSFFIFNGMVSFYTSLFSTLELWTLYNGLISYVLIGFLFGVEFLIRKKLKSKWDGPHED